ncbi:uncharacterized protein LOC107271265 isoform X2 [Cephus cinctus]|uniref:Uncharacterized protein LOC107271265 isoform X2 n=1 Tax=Cephus cinctus TaxID=211228 RepID=A0AAJ7RNK0_CEPCN|nr:uncharacterized protein LOC107271265 isoform X2 [Cephus cinctus]
MATCHISSKSRAIFAGIFSLIQALIWCAIAILGILLYTCKISVTESSGLTYLFYLVYFYSGECGAVEIELQEDATTTRILWPTNGTAAALKTYMWIIVYLMLSLVWAISSLLFLIVTVAETRGAEGVKLRVPWLVTTAVFLILDVAGTIVYSVDISFTEDLQQLLEFVGLHHIDDTLGAYNSSSIFGSITMGPSIIATLIFSRLIIIWVLNLTLLIHIAHDVRQTEKKKALEPRQPREPYKEYLKKLSTVGPIPDVKWEPYQRKRSEVPIVKPLSKPSPPNERKRKQSDYGQYLYYARHLPQARLYDIQSETPPTAKSEITDPFAASMVDPHIPTVDYVVSESLKKEIPPGSDVIKENLQMSKNPSRGGDDLNLLY